MDLLKKYRYEFPPELIAHEPIEPRDTARLFVYDTATNTVTYDYFYNLATYVPGALLVRNTTKVVPARLRAVRENGQEIELFMLYDRGVVGGVVQALVNQRIQEGEVLTVAGRAFEAVNTKEKQMYLRLCFPESALLPLLYEHGSTPVPPYIHSHASENVLRDRYQTIFAEQEGSVAAPTASLHFTQRVEDSLITAEVDTVPVTLNVGLGTFAPIFPENFETRSLHHESYMVPLTTAQAIAAAKREGRPVCATGTTVVRTLESGAKAILTGQAAAGETDLFIFPPYEFMVSDMLLTNFHVPQSSLLCLVDAFLEHKGATRDVLSLYEEAIAERFRLFSFGDAMLVL